MALSKIAGFEVTPRRPSRSMSVAKVPSLSQLRRISSR
jgi:hypothetical protein